ncbi:sulfurtransferase [Cellulomonas sp. C5510]|uniref:sulfurtransferase n=1 Tax=Cellulomonas sp. C5510 TaxID=2871170 RepID=UPI001C94DFEB|nr:sulfurtransferase [Cellulomonas sp. C5510]QZN85106.1 sulfurtransferase [Cellulomonas sp. C5510]
MPDVIVSAADLARELDGPRPPRLLDVRWTLGGPPGIGAYREGHLPGASYVDLDTELAAAPSAAAGRHPLPDVADLQSAARRWGLRAGEPVVVYDDSGAMSAARAWWLLRWAGVEDVRILDGGLAAWTAAGGAVETGERDVEPGDVELSPGHLPTLDADGAAQWADEGVLLDAHAAERYRGEVEPVDQRAGHIPGAVSAPTAQNLGADGRFLPADDLTARFAALGVPEGDVAVYCGSGVTAAHQAAALVMAGRTPVLYPGSWSQWSADPERPVATGEDAAAR